MAKDWKQISIYLVMLVSLSQYTMVSTFLPEIASDKGVPLWVVGFIFSMDPISGLVVSYALGKYMFKIGRKTCLGLGLLFSSFSVFVLVPIQSLDMIALLIVSFLSRILAGVCSGFANMGADSIIISDYPDDIELIIGREEAAIGIGLIVGPIIGTILFATDLFYSLLIFGFIIILFIPLCLKMLGTLREYKIEDTQVNTCSLLLKPVRNI
jgi:MFS transporter, DHA1 family, tetracycline resistance protein